MYRIEIKLDEPLTAGYGVAFSNEIRSLDHIPATMLRGALYEELVLAGRGDEAESWFGPRRRWTSAWPANCIPMPLAFSQVKGDAFGGDNGIWNDLSLSASHKPDGSWRQVKVRWLALDNGVPHSALKVDPGVDMHVGLRYDTQSVRGSALFSRQAIAAGTTFDAYVSEVPELRTWTVSLGKRHSVSGRATIRFTQNAGPFGFHARENHAFLYLATPALLPGPHGCWLRGLDRATIKLLTGVHAEVIGASAFEPVGGWNGRWGIPQEQAIAVRAGSCWRIEMKPENAARINEWLRKIGEAGLGIRCHEGFGVVCVNPRWLTETLEEPFCRSQTQER